MIQLFKNNFIIFGAPVCDHQLFKFAIIFCANFGFTTIGNLVNFFDQCALEIADKLALSSCFNFVKIDSTTTLLFLNNRGVFFARQITPFVAEFDKKIIRQLRRKEHFFHDLVVQNVVFEEIKSGELNISKFFGEATFYEKFGANYFLRQPDAVLLAPNRKIAIEFENTTKHGTLLKEILKNCIFDISAGRIHGSRWYFLKNENSRNYQLKLMEATHEIFSMEKIFDPKTGELFKRKQIEIAARNIHFPRATNRILRGI